MNTFHKSALKAKNHIRRNKVAYALGTIAALAVALQQSNKNAFYAFLEEKGIDPIEYYCPEAFAQMNV